MMRLVPDHTAQIEHAPPIEFTFDGAVIVAHAGETVLAALLRSGIRHLRSAPGDGAPRGAFCCMGLCQECTVQVDKCRIESCRLTATTGLKVQSLGRQTDG